MRVWVEQQQPFHLFNKGLDRSGDLTTAAILSISRGSRWELGSQTAAISSILRRSG